MKIETKFNVNQTVYFMNENKVESSEIVAIIITINMDGHYPVYKLPFKKETLNKYENHIFISKEELLRSL